MTPMPRSVFLLAIAFGAVLLAGGCKNRSHRVGDTLTCTPGESLTIGCDGTLGYHCSGDPVLMACDGAIPPNNCTSSTQFASDDDGGDGVCPLLRTACPASGRITIQHRPYSTGSSYQCYWDILHGGSAAPPDAGR